MLAESHIEHLIQRSILRLLDYCRKNNWAGFDPYDGLNSRVFSSLPFLRKKLLRLIFIQGMKRCPVNFRPLFLVPKGQNPKGIALFCSALIKLENLGLADEALIVALLERLANLRSRKSPYYCWGYNFDWQTRRFLLPKFTPNIICTTFAGNALLDAYEKYRKNEHLEMAMSSGYFITKGLNITKNDDELCFSYTTLDNGQVHNANLLGAAFLARLYLFSGKSEFMNYALRSVRFSVKRQKDTGSWPYGEAKTQAWIDNFHTGYNLVALTKFMKYTGNTEFLESIRKGYLFYKSNFFTPYNIPKYYHNRVYPIDIHSIAQSIITLIELKSHDESAIDLATSICKWAINNMQSERGYFFYQQWRSYKNRIPYMRWSQAWMLLALSILLGEQDEGKRANVCIGSGF